MIEQLSVLIKLAARNLLRHPRKNLLIGALIAVGVAGLFVANSVLQTTNRGLETLLVNSLSGELMIGAQADESYSIFGNEIPIVSEYESIPPLSVYPELITELEKNGDIAVWTPVVSAAASMNVGGQAWTVPIFGVDAETYFSVCGNIAITEESRQSLKRGGVVLNAKLAQEIETALGRSLVPDEPIVFSMYSGNSFKLRRGYYAGTAAYSGNHDVVNRIVLADPTIARGLINYTVGLATRSATDNGSGKQTPSTGSAESLDDLFSGSSDTQAETGNSLTLAEVETLLERTESEREQSAVDTGAWSFVLLKTKDGNYRKAGRVLSGRFLAEDLNLRVQDWKTASGSSIQILFALQSAFYFGMFFLAFGAILVIMNSLVLSVLERTGEIGTMRSMGAGKLYIARMLAVESISLTFAGACAGILLGIGVCVILGKSGISLDNPLLVSMFGGSVLRPYISAGNVLLHLAAGFLVGSCAWMYPLFVALRIPPIVAINKGNS